MRSSIKPEPRCATRFREVPMSMRSMFVALAAVVAAAPFALRAQDSGADFSSARQQYLSGQSRQAAQTVILASLYVRQQVGRSHDETVGMKLVDAENQLEKLASGLRAGTVGTVKALDKTFNRIDLLLAQHHLQLATAGLARPRADDIPVVAHDVDLAAFHYERSITLDGHALVGDQVTATTEAHALAKEMGSTGAVPKTAPRVVATLEKLVLATPVVAAVR
jgi:hypothetical protein